MGWTAGATASEANGGAGSSLDRPAEGFRPRMGLGPESVSEKW